jgi:hypothetical protein
MNFQDPNLPSAKKAELEYLDGDFAILSPGDYVLCEVSGNRIPLEELRYWSVARQEAYASSEISQTREEQIKKGSKA